jgi:hypothetical protein
MSRTLLNLRLKQVRASTRADWSDQTSVHPAPGRSMSRRCQPAKPGDPDFSITPLLDLGAKCCQVIFTFRLVDMLAEAD